MNTLIKILPLILCICFLAGCGTIKAQNEPTSNATSCPLTGNTPDPSLYENKELKQAGTDIYYYVISSSATDAEIEIITMSCQEMTYGAAYYIEKEVDGEFKKLEWKKDVAFIEIAYIIKTDEPQKEKYNWKDSLGELEKGTYRIVTDFYRNGEKITAYFQFEVE